MDRFSHLPQHVAHKILRYLTPEELCTALKVSRTWYELINYNVIWKPICMRAGVYKNTMCLPKMSVDGGLPPPCSYKRLYQKLMTNWKFDKSKRYEFDSQGDILLMDERTILDLNWKTRTGRVWGLKQGIVLAPQLTQVFTLPALPHASRISMVNPKYLVLASEGNIVIYQKNDGKLVLNQCYYLTAQNIRTVNLEWVEGGRNDKTGTVQLIGLHNEILVALCETYYDFIVYTIDLTHNTCSYLREDRLDVVDVKSVPGFILVLRESSLQVYEDRELALDTDVNVCNIVKLADVYISKWYVTITNGRPFDMIFTWKRGRAPSTPFIRKTGNSYEEMYILNDMSYVVLTKRTRPAGKEDMLLCDYSVENRSWSTWEKLWTATLRITTSTSEEVATAIPALNQIAKLYVIQDTYLVVQSNRWDPTDSRPLSCSGFAVLHMKTGNCLFKHQADEGIGRLVDVKHNTVLLDFAFPKAKSIIYSFDPTL